MNLRMPKMILFDYGQTLGIEIKHDPVGGNAAALQAAAANPRGLTAEAVSAAYTEWLADIQRVRLSEDIEIHEHQILRHLYDRLQITFDRPLDEIETLYWDAASPPYPPRTSAKSSPACAASACAAASSATSRFPASP